MLKLKPIDIIAFCALMFALYIISVGDNKTASAVVLIICTYYFTKKAQHDNEKIN